MSKQFIKSLTLCVISSSVLLVTGCATTSMHNDGPSYTISIKNDMKSERLAPVLIVGDADDSKIWVGRYVSAEARTQFTTGNPTPLAEQLGGEQLQPGRVAVNGELTFTFRTKAKTARITAMVHPDITPDNYVTAKLELTKPGVIPLERFDIGDNEKRMTVERVGQVGTVTLTLK
jgi:hypothetical protein